MRNRDLREAIQQHCERLTRVSQAAIHCTISATVDSLPERTQEQLFLAFREALSNALRHASASRISITLTRHQQSLQLSISDDGTGFDTHLNTASRAQHPAGLGLSMIAERCDSVGAATDIHSQPGDGTTITLHIPIPATETADKQTHCQPDRNLSNDSDHSAPDNQTTTADGQRTRQTATPA